MKPQIPNAVLFPVVLCILAPLALAAEADRLPAIELRPLTEIIDSALADPRLAGALIGIQAENLQTEKIVYSHKPDSLLNPASVTKLFTTAAALCLLHPDYRFKTEIYAHDRPDRGVIKGPLYLKGYGDPYLVNERLIFLAQELHALGIERIEGPLILDDTYFDQVEAGPGWSQDNTSRPYQSPMGALSLNFNAFAVLVFPADKLGGKARIELVPDSDHFKVDNEVKTANGSSRVWIDVDPMGNHSRVKLRGQISLHHSGARYYALVTNPTMYTGRSFAQALGQNGIKVRPWVKRGTVPRYAELIYTLRSPALTELVRKVNKRSQNFMAEQLYKTMGAEFFGEPATWYKGQQVMSAFLEEEVGIPPGSYVLHNGSGLNDVNRVSTAQTVALLRAMWHRPDVSPDFMASLAIAGADGTVANRFTHPSLARSMRVKTGSLERVRALAGYIHNRDQQPIAFSIFINRYRCRSFEILQIIDRIASALSRSNADGMVEETTEVESVPPVQQASSPAMAPVGPPEGNEEADIPIGEKN